MATSKIRIINAALLLLGKKGCSDITNDSPDYIKNCSALYDEFYPSIFAMDYNWRFAIKQFSLNKVTNPPKYPNYMYAYELPSDFGLTYKTDGRIPFEIVGNLLYCNSPSGITLYYTGPVSEDLLPEYFKPYIHYYMAALFCMPITERTDLTISYENKVEKLLFKAIQSDSQTQPSLQFGNLVYASKYAGPALI